MNYMDSNNSPEEELKNKSKTFLDLNNIRKANENKYLTLRKKKRNNEIKKEFKSKFNTLYEHQYSIHLNTLKTDNDDIRNFSIDSTRPEFTIKLLKYLLNSNDDDEVKFGLYAIRKFYQNLLSEISRHNELNNDANKIGEAMNGLQINLNGIGKFPLYKLDKDKLVKKTNLIMELFLNNDIINLLFQVIQRSLNKYEIKYHTNIYECFWILINMSAVKLTHIDYENKFNSSFVREDNLETLLTLIDPQKYPPEIIYNVLILLGNITYGNPLIKEVMVHSSLTSILFDFLKKTDKINTEITLKIFRLLYTLYDNCAYEMNIEAYQILFKIFSLCLKSFKNNDMVSYSLSILSTLSSKPIPEVINCFDDLELMCILNDIIIQNPIKNNEININKILDIFCNIVGANNDRINKHIVEPGLLTLFYNNLLIKYNKEDVIINFKIEENIIIALNNIIYYNYNNSIKYIFGEGKEILKFFLRASKSVFPKARFFGLKSFVNMFINIDIDVNIELLNEIVNSVFLTLYNDYDRCYYISCQCLAIIINLSKKQKVHNDLKFYMQKTGIGDLMEKVKTQILNDSKSNKIKKEDIENYMNFLEEIKDFLNKEDEEK